MGVGPIPRSKIMAYGRDDLGLEDDDALDHFCAILRAMDDEYVSSSNSPPKTKTQKAVPIDDVDGVKEVFRVIEFRKEREASEKKKLSGQS